MSAKRYTDEFKIEAVRLIVEYGRPVAEVAEVIERLGYRCTPCTAGGDSKEGATWFAVSKVTRTRKCVA